MCWGVELWDHFDAICTYTSVGIDFLENSVGKFMKERSVIECEYFIASTLFSLLFGTLLTVFFAY